MVLRKRADWGARAPKRRTVKELKGPSTGHWNGPTVLVFGKRVWEHIHCDSLVRGIQNFHMDGRGWSDIAYNFVLCPHGVIYEGRGLNVVNAANGTNAANQSSHAVMSLAGIDNPFEYTEKLTFVDAVRYISRNSDAPDMAVGHRDHKQTECPGNERYNWIRQGMVIPGATPPVSPPPSPVGANHPLLKLGSRGDAVRQVQKIIHDKAGGNISVDGIFGPKTESRVRDLQRFFKLTPDGIVGPKTWSVLEFLASRR